MCVVVTCWLLGVQVCNGFCHSLSGEQQQQQGRPHDPLHFIITMSRQARQGRVGGGGKKRKQQQAGPAKGSSRADKPPKKAKRSNDAFYEAIDSDPDEEKHADRYDVSAAAVTAVLLLLLLPPPVEALLSACCPACFLLLAAS